MADALRRTRLAAERTQLAWWRTGLGALAIGVGIGRVIPLIHQGVDSWPYIALGLAFALYGLLLIVYGTLRGQLLDGAIQRGGFAAMQTSLNLALAGGAGLLSIATCLVIVFG